MGFTGWVDGIHRVSGWDFQRVGRWDSKGGQVGFIG
jgi:hypothetical protein